MMLSNLSAKWAVEPYDDDDDDWQWTLNAKK
jgi:hypothetical protein